MTIQLKLTMAFIAVILVANTILSLVTVGYVERVWIREVQTRVRLDLNSARAAYEDHVDGMARFLKATALGQRLNEALTHSDPEVLGRVIRRIYPQSGLDVLNVLDARGRVLYRGRNPAQIGDDLSGNPVVALAMEHHDQQTGTVLLSADELAREGNDLAERARFKLQPTPAARPTNDEYRNEGMVVCAATPIFGDDGALLGVVYAADLLNRRYAIVDAIRSQVFPDATFEGKPLGTVTIFQRDLRIATNVVAEDGTRAVGTRMSQAVYEEVFVRGQTWAAPAQVVNDWYITAYEPIHDPDGHIIGALYVGLLQAPFDQKRNVIAWVFVGTVTGATLVSLVLLYLVTRLVLRPIRRILSMCRKVVAGDLTARVTIRPPGEMGVLCEAIDRMGDAVAQREDQLKLATRQQIGRSEKLASIGRLAAGVAHEINNPLTGVLTFAHLLRERENMEAQDRQDLELIIHETTRVAEIVRGLLDFARERPAERQWQDVNEIVSRTMRLLRNQKQFNKIEVKLALDEHVPPVYVDVNQIQQVLLNLALNACESMPEGGTLTIRTQSRESDVCIMVTDVGCGIKREHLDQIFDPFFTTKPVGKGTGLGLSVSYGIVQQHGGALEVQSEEGRGTTFTIVLPVAEGDAVPADGKKG